MRKRCRARVPAWLLGALAVAVVCAPTASVAQSQFIPYYGKNLVHYNTFNWHVYETDHFSIYYYPEMQQHLERVAGYAESAYQQISSDLKHDLPTKVPLILFKTHAEFEQENVIPGAASEGVGAFAEPTRNRMLLPIDAPSDLLYRLITHELTHIFQFDIIPQSLIRRNMPLWIDEGMADYETGYWAPIDLMTVRDAAVTDSVPKMSELEGYGDFSNPRLIYNLGHACFEFIEAKWGKEGVRQFMFSLRKSVIGGGENAYEEYARMVGRDGAAGGRTGFELVDDLVHQLIFDLAMLLVAPPDQHVSAVQQFVADALVRFVQTGFDHFPALLQQRLESIGNRCVDVLRINFFRSLVHVRAALGPDYDLAFS